MRNKINSIFFIFSFLFLFIFLDSFSFVQAASYGDNGIKTNIDINKSWVIRFNRTINKSTVNNSNIIVTDESGNQVPVNLSIGKDESSIVVSPNGQYDYGKTYNLIIKDGLKASDRNISVKTTKIQFTVKNNPIGTENKNITVCLDAGRGGNDTGSVSQSGIKEKDVDLSVALKAGKILQDNGINVIYTRTDDSNKDLKSRFDISNNGKADFFISIHVNWVDNNQSANGIETWFSGSDDISKKLAQAVQDELIKNTGLVDRKIKVESGSHEIMRGTSASPIMVELGFMSNPQEAAIIGSADFQNKSAQAIANGILKSLNLVDKSKSDTISSIKNLSTIAVQNSNYTLPLNVSATMSDGSTKNVNVIWNAKTVDTSKLGEFTYQGTVASYSSPISLVIKVVDKSDPALSNVVCLDPGHGIGSDTGATGVTGVQEDDVTLKVALKAGKILEDHGVKVVYTRTSDERSTPMSVVDSLQRRCDTSNNANAKYFVSIHNNSADIPNAYGTETLYFTGNSEGERLANAIQESLVSELGSYDRGLKDGSWLYVAKNTNAVAVLTELGFLSNPDEEQKLNSDDYQNKCADAIAKGILQCLGL